VPKPGISKLGISKQGIRNNLACAWLTCAIALLTGETSAGEQPPSLGNAHMNNSDRPSNHNASATHYDVVKLLQYRGPSLRREQLLPSDVSILDYRNSDQNERHISTLLSSQGIPFHLDRPQKGWSQSKLRLSVSVPREFLDSAQALLTAATKAGAIEVVEGLQGLPGIPEDPGRTPKQ